MFPVSYYLSDILTIAVCKVNSSTSMFYIGMKQNKAKMSVKMHLNISGVIFMHPFLLSSIET